MTAFAQSSFYFWPFHTNKSFPNVPLRLSLSLSLIYTFYKISSNRNWIAESTVIYPFAYIGRPHHRQRMYNIYIVRCENFKKKNLLNSPGQFSPTPQLKVRIFSNSNLFFFLEKEKKIHTAAIPLENVKVNIKKIYHWFLISFQSLKQKIWSFPKTIIIIQQIITKSLKWYK